MKRKIIVADDSKDVTISLQQILMPYATVEIVHSTSACLEAMEAAQYDSAILDVQFDYGMSGLELATILRRDYPNIRIVIISAIDYSTDVQRRTMELGAVFLQKTVKTNDLLRALEINVNAE